MTNSFHGNSHLFLIVDTLPLVATGNFGHAICLPTVLVICVYAVSIVICEQPCTYTHLLVRTRMEGSFDRPSVFKLQSAPHKLATKFNRTSQREPTWSRPPWRGLLGLQLGLRPLRRESCKWSMREVYITALQRCQRTICNHKVSSVNAPQ